MLSRSNHCYVLSELSSPQLDINEKVCLPFPRHVDAVRITCAAEEGEVEWTVFKRNQTAVRGDSLILSAGSVRGQQIPYQEAMAL